MRQQLAQLGNGAHALAIQILGNPDDAADAVHDSFARVLAKPGAYDINFTYLQYLRTKSLHND